MKVALVTDWMIGGGAERVVEGFHKLYPEAPIYTSYISDSQRAYFKDADIRVLWTGKLPFAAKLRKFIGILRERAFEAINFSGYDVVISINGAEAKGIITPKNVLHISYINSPTHYYWVRYDEYLKSPGFGILDPLARIGLRALISGRRKWDYKAAQRPDVVIGNSTEIQTRIKKFYHRDSIVIHPPVQTDRFALNATGNRKGFVTAGRQTPYKRTDLAVAACTELDLPLKVIGNGPDHAKLLKIAGETIEFLTDVNDKEIVVHFQNSEAFIFTSLDDFGIVPVEAMATGTPVIAFGAGGVKDTIVDGKTGLYFNPQTKAALVAALKKFSSQTFDPKVVHDQAEKFSLSNFQDSIRNFVDTEYKKHRSKQ